MCNDFMKHILRDIKSRLFKIAVHVNKAGSVLPVFVQL
jgi:hypothetical protein